MKIIKLILFFTIARYCFSQTDICATKFNEELISKCQAIDKDTCELTDYSPRCISSNHNDCSKGNNDQSYCHTLFPKSFPEYKCYYNSGKCEETHTSCSDYNSLINGVNFKEDKNLCKSFYAGDNKFECRLSDGGMCTQFYKKCEDIKSTDFGTSYEFQTTCQNNLPSEYNYRCDLNSEGKCEKVERQCNSDLKNIDEDDCHRLNPGDSSKQKCVFSGGVCKQQIINCGDKSYSNCHGHPLKGSGNNYNFDYTYECAYNNDDGLCEDKQITCEDCPSSEAEMCTQYIAKNPEIKRCFLDESNRCIEMYNDCSDYNNDNQIYTNREGCEKIIPKTNPTDKCVYITEEDKCVRSSTIEKECNAYEGKSKKMCELITLFPTTRDYCILDKDSTCKEKPIECSQAIDEEDCLNIAKANDENKRCAYKNNKCYEEYIRCEDFISNTQVSNPFTSGSTSCSGIKLYNGMRCEEDPTTGRCRSVFKTCEQAQNEDECKLIAKTGVSNPERKVCDYVDYGELDTSPFTKCREIYKYCTDYRGTNDLFCEQIKPYNDDGDKIDNRFRCEYENDIGCQRIPVKCTDAKNPTVCKEFSDYIKDHDKKHCVFYDDTCTEFYRECEDVEDVDSDCENNIIDGYLKHVCEKKNGKCVRTKNCQLFENLEVEYYTELCQSISPNCSYSNGKCEYKEKSCEDTLFYPDFSSDDEQKKQKCENMTASKNYKKCVLKEDKSGCEEVYRELSYSSSYYSNTNPPDNTPQESSSYFFKKGIHFIIILLSLLF